MSSEPSTSSDDATLDIERTVLLQQALSQAGVNRAQKFKNNSNQLHNKLRGSPEASVKTRITEHPLIPIVQLLFEKCEKASESLNEEIFDMDDVVKLFNELDANGITGSTDDKELDDLMRQAILALRTCLVELEKLSKLTFCFKDKYLASLKRTVCHEALIGSTVDSDDELIENNQSTTDSSDIGGIVASTLATLQTASGALSIPLSLSQQVAMLPQAATFSANLKLLKSLGFPSLPAKLELTGEKTERSPEKSEEEKSIIM